MTRRAGGWIRMQTNLIDSPMVRQLHGAPMWQSYLRIGDHSIAGRSRHRWLARCKAVVNHATYIICGRRDSNRLWWRLRWG